MARLFLMTWIPAKRRWNKHYKGKTYSVTARALGMPPTPWDSYQAANAWWLAKQAEIDGEEPAAEQTSEPTSFHTVRDAPENAG